MFCEDRADIHTNVPNVPNVPKPNLKPVCGVCYKKREYERLGLSVLGKVSEGSCQDCGGPAELLVDTSPPQANPLQTLAETISREASI